MAKYHTTVDEIVPEPVAEKDGWRRMDYRILLGRHNVGPEAQASLYRSVFPPGAAHKKHLHTKSDELVYVIRWRGAHGQGDDEWEVGPGSCYYIPKNVPHWLRNLDHVEPVELVGVYLDAGSLEETGYVFLGEVAPHEMKVW